MPVTDVRHDVDQLTLTITAEFAAPVERVWQVYADPRQLERIWGPEGHPATFVDHDLRPGSRITYYMTGPEGEKYCGWWEVKTVDEPREFTFEDGFADEDFRPLPDLPVSHNTYAFTDLGDGRTRTTYTTRYASAEALQQVLEMGVEEGATSAINQIDELLAA